VRPALAEIEDAKHEASSHISEVAGLLPVTASTGFAPLYLIPAIAEFLARHAKVEIDLDLSDPYVDLVEGGFDLAVRVGELPDSSLRAKHLADSRRLPLGISASSTLEFRPLGHASAPRRKDIATPS
jgi:DNA-binding transcriptional LysR family regulator